METRVKYIPLAHLIGSELLEDTLARLKGEQLKARGRSNYFYGFEFDDQGNPVELGNPEEIDVMFWRDFTIWINEDKSDVHLVSKVDPHRAWTEVEVPIVKSQLIKKGAGGRPPDHDWDRIFTEVGMYVAHNPIPKTLNAFATTLIEKLDCFGIDEDQDVKVPDIRTLSSRVRPIYERLKSRGNL